VQVAKASDIKHEVTVLINFTCPYRCSTLYTDMLIFTTGLQKCFHIYGKNVLLKPYL